MPNVLLLMRKERRKQLLGYEPSIVSGVEDRLRQTEHPNALPASWHLSRSTAAMRAASFICPVGAELSRDATVGAMSAPTQSEVVTDSILSLWKSPQSARASATIWKRRPVAPSYSGCSDWGPGSIGERNARRRVITSASSMWSMRFLRRKPFHVASFISMNDADSPTISLSGFSWLPRRSKVARIAFFSRIGSKSKRWLRNQRS